MAEAIPTTGKTLNVRPDLKLEGFSPSYVPSENAWHSHGISKIESWSDPSTQFLATSGREHGFVSAVRMAFAHHVPLQFGPEHIWTLIIQSVSKHIEQNAEKYRSKFVNFDGKQLLRIHRDNFSKGSPNNDWAGCFTEFSSMIESFVGAENKANLCPTFSTQTTTSQAVAELSLMDCMKSYFEYRVRTKCGISKVRLQGTPDDWSALRKALEPLREFDLGWWVDILAPIIDNLAAASAGGAVMKDFWQYIYKHWDLRGSGAHPTVDGWITNFFLYINEKQRDPKSFRSLETFVAESKQKQGHRWHSPGVPQKAVPTGITKTPFIWEYLGDEIPMTFYGGFVGANMEGEFVTPVLGWAVGEKVEEAPKKPQQRNWW